MSTASVDTADSAIFSALNALTIANGGSFAFVGRWVGPPPARDGITQETFGKTPAALLAWEGERGSVDIETLPGDFLLKARTYWTVLIGASDARGATQVVKGSPGAIGSLALLSQVIGAVNGLIVANPAATLSMTVTGTPNATVSLAGATLKIGVFTYQPTATSVTLDGSGNGTIHVACIAPPGGFGNYPPPTVATWQTPVPAGLNNTATVSAILTVGVDGGLRNRRVHYAEARPVAVIPGRLSVVAARFYFDRRAETTGPYDDSTRMTSIQGSQHLNGTADPPLDPIDQFNAST